MRRSLKLLTACLVIGFAAAPAIAGGNANFVLGGRSLDENDWAPVEEHGVLGVTVDFGRDRWPVNLAIGYYLSHGADEFGPFDLSATIVELTFGVHKTWRPGGGTRPFLGGGIAGLSVEAELELGGLGVSDDDAGQGLYISGGVYWRLGSRFNIGLEGRACLGSDIEIAGADVDVDYVQGGMILGWGWPPE